MYHFKTYQVTIQEKRLRQGTLAKGQFKGNVV